MKNKTQVTLNILLVCAFGATVSMCIEINEKVKSMQVMLTEMRERENEYFARRVRVLEILESYAKKKIKGGEFINPKDSPKTKKTDINYLDAY